MLMESEAERPFIEDLLQELSGSYVSSVKLPNISTIEIVAQEELPIHSVEPQFIPEV